MISSEVFFGWNTNATSSSIHSDLGRKNIDFGVYYIII
jgi:hypothetical protein